MRSLQHVASAFVASLADLVWLSCLRLALNCTAVNECHHLQVKLHEHAKEERLPKMLLEWQEDACVLYHESQQHANVLKELVGQAAAAAPASVAHAQDVSAATIAHARLLAIAPVFHSLCLSPDKVQAVL